MQRPWRQSRLEPAFRRNTAADVYTFEAAHNPEVAGSNPAPATEKGLGNRASLADIRAPAHFSNPQSGGTDGVHGHDCGQITLPPGWASIDVKLRGDRFRFITTEPNPAPAG
jgi:hypothetical protein